MYMSEQGRWVFIRVPKTGSTALLEALERKYPDTRKVGSVHHRMSQVRNPHFWKHKVVVGVMRDPLQWIRSMYDSLVRGEGHDETWFLNFEAAHRSLQDFSEQLKYHQADWFLPGQATIIPIGQFERLESLFDIDLSKRRNVTPEPSQIPEDFDREAFYTRFADDYLAWRSAHTTYSV